MKKLVNICDICLKEIPGNQRFLDYSLTRKFSEIFRISDKLKKQCDATGVVFEDIDRVEHCCGDCHSKILKNASFALMESFHKIILEARGGAK